MYTTLKVDIFEEAEFFRFSKNRNVQKLTTDFEKRTKRQAETEACVLFDVDH